MTPTTRRTLLLLVGGVALIASLGRGAQSQPAEATTPGPQLHTQRSDVERHSQPSPQPQVDGTAAASRAAGAGVWHPQRQEAPGQLTQSH